MATSVSIKGTTYNDFASGFVNGVPTAGVYHALPEVGAIPTFDVMCHDRREIRFPGVPGTGEKDYSNNEGIKRFIYIDLVIVGTSSTYRSALKTLMDSLDDNTRYNVTVGSSFDGCKLLCPCGPPIQTMNFLGVIAATHRFVFKQLSLTN